MVNYLQKTFSFVDSDNNYVISMPLFLCSEECVVVIYYRLTLGMYICTYVNSFSPCEFYTSTCTCALLELLRAITPYLLLFRFWCGSSG